MDTKLPVTGFLSILESFQDLFMSVLGVQNALKQFLFSGLFLGRLFRISDSIVRRLGVQNDRFRTEGIAQIEIVFKEFQARFLVFF